MKSAILMRVHGIESIFRCCCLVSLSLSPVKAATKNANSDDEEREGDRGKTRRATQKKIGSGRETKHKIA